MTPARESETYQLPQRLAAKSIAETGQSSRHKPQPSQAKSFTRAVSSVIRMASNLQECAQRPHAQQSVSRMTARCPLTKGSVRWCSGWSSRCRSGASTSQSATTVGVDPSFFRLDNRAKLASSEVLPVPPLPLMMTISLMAKPRREAGRRNPPEERFVPRQKGI